jgi:hypothetical protein
MIFSDSQEMFLRAVGKRAEHLGTKFYCQFNQSLRNQESPLVAYASYDSTKASSRKTKGPLSFCLGLSS